MSLAPRAKKEMTEAAKSAKAAKATMGPKGTRQYEQTHPGRPMEAKVDSGEVNASLYASEYEELKSIGKQKGISFATLMKILVENYVANPEGIIFTEGVERVYKQVDLEKGNRTMNPLPGNPLRRVCFIITPDQKHKVRKLATSKQVSDTAILRGLIKRFLDADTPRRLKITL